MALAVVIVVSISFTSSMEEHLLEPRPNRFVSRAPLIQKLGIEPQRRITLVEAPHGYGKTRLLEEWEKMVRLRGVRTALIVATRPTESERILLDGCAKALASRHAASTISTFEDLLAAISLFHQPLVLFLDDIEGFEERLLNRIVLLMESASDKVRFVLACAPPCPVPLGRHAAAGQLTRVTSEDLLFDAESARHFLPKDCTQEDVLDLHQLTGGWPLALSVLSGSNDKIAGGDEVLRAMISQLLEKQPDAVRELLVTMSITSAFTSQHAAFLIGRTDAHQLISEARKGGFPFIYHPETDAYRYHGVVREFLKAQLQRDERIDLRRVHGRAAHWHISRNEPLEAMRYALCVGDRALIDAVARLQGGDWPMALVKGMSGLDELATIPLISLTHAPRLWIAAIYALVQAGEIAAADAQMRLLRALCTTDDPVFLAERDAMAILLRHYHDEPVLDGEAEALVQRIESVQAPFIIDTLIRHNLPMFAAADAGDIGRARRLGETACASYRALGAILADAYTRLRVGQLALYQGDPDQALAHYREVHLETMAHLEDTAHQLMARLFIAETLQFQGDFAKAQTSLDPVLHVIERMDPWPPLIETYYHVRARAALWRSERAWAIALLEDGQKHAHRRGATRVFLSFCLARAEIRGSGDMIELIDNIMQGICIEPDRERIFSPWLHFRARLARVRLTLADDPDLAAMELDRLAKETGKRGMATLFHASRLLRTLLGVATREMTSNVIDGSVLALRNAQLTGIAMEELWLSDQALRKLPDGTSALEKLALVTANTDPLEMSPLADPTTGSAVVLSPRERDILDLMIVGLSGSEMAARLHLSESSVKIYRNALYRKFGVHQRSALIATVRAQGLAPHLS